MAPARPQTSLACLLIAMAVAMLPVACWVNFPADPGAAVIVTLITVAFLGGLLTPFRWSGVILSSAAVTVHAIALFITTFQPLNFVAIVVAMGLLALPFIGAALIGSVLRTSFTNVK